MHSFHQVLPGIISCFLLFVYWAGLNSSLCEDLLWSGVDRLFVENSMLVSGAARLGANQGNGIKDAINCNSRTRAYPHPALPHKA